MHLFIVEGDYLAAEFRRKFGPAHTYDFCSATDPDLLVRLAAADVAFDLRAWPELHYEQPRQPLFYHTTSQTLARLFRGEALPFGPVFGFCALPTLLDRPLLEISVYRPEDAALLAPLAASLGTAYCVVQDRVGLVTPRVVCMAINEACHALQEGLASIGDIERAIKQATTAAYGPFEWATRIGVDRVYETLEALYQDTHDDRYRIAPLLKTMFLRGQSFLLE
ncbi:3-hydroxyacyl-CoA dehydrogenase family protein [Hymenobacter elongatus]|uniref:3-hydroxyacyl-CoA dehydrogenase n=1 Tax=Hymenobacter elongatus TaxID=877208 RepID=A0A4Z0PJ76_9BACT|nr:3-hydroxyacyl-CoA dehydrogenase family protein [Hymenobacter elongatus]TGE14910.1 3-hydroxyacyl-CoA dehydrogenase [Hymenobacter elongatus]